MMHPVQPDTALNSFDHGEDYAIVHIYICLCISVVCMTTQNLRSTDLDDIFRVERL